MRDLCLTNQAKGGRRILRHNDCSFCLGKVSTGVNDGVMYGFLSCLRGIQSPSGKKHSNLGTRQAAVVEANVVYGDLGVSAAMPTSGNLAGISNVNRCVVHCAHQLAIPVKLNFAR